MKDTLFVITGLGLLILAAVMFLLGWLFPVDGPFDKQYDKWQESRRPHVNASAQIQESQKVELTIEELEELLFPSDSDLGG